jgi:hypothetical protein
MPVLMPHPSKPPVADSVSVQWEWDGTRRLRLRYHVKAALQQLELSGPRDKPERRDGLWRTTCFELFLRAPGDQAYYEFNFSPSADWAAYAFTNTRSGQAELALPQAPDISGRVSDTRFSLEATVTLPDILLGTALKGAVSAVIAGKVGSTSYWALHHPDPNKPDFHHPGCFVADLSPACGT